MRRAAAFAVLAAAVVAVHAAPKGAAPPPPGKLAADGGKAELVGFTGTPDGGARDGGTTFDGFVLGRAMTAQGDLSKDEIKSVVKAHHSEINGCYQALLGRSAGKKTLPQGTALLQFEVEPEGKVASAAVTPQGFDDATFVACLVERVRTWTFAPRPSGAKVKVAYPVKLYPPD